MSGYCVAYSYNAADQLTLWPGMHSYEYDDNGALTTVKTADGQAEQQTFSYHPTGLMNTALFNNQTQTLTNLWDADEHRVQFSVGEDDYTSVFDVTAGIPAVIKEITPQGTIYYVREPGGELIARVVGESRRYYHFDELGSTRLITDGSGAVTDRYAYDAYGAVIAHDRDAGTIDQPYQYVGQLGYYTHSQAPEFGWLQLGVRFYDPETGRFEREDPIPALGAAYAYAAAMPLAAVDPSGYVCYICTRNLEMPCGLGAIVPLLHVFIWCDREAGQAGPWRPRRPRPGYDRSDPVIGYGRGGIGDFDREYFENRSLGASRRLDCQPLDLRLEPCIRRRIRHDLDRSQPNYTWPASQYDFVRHNCQHYVDDILRGCGGYARGNR